MNFEQLKRVPLETILRHYGIEFQTQGDVLIAKKCPLPTHSSKELRSFKVKVIENYWRCWSKSCSAASGRNGGDPVDFICLKEGINSLDAARKLAEMFCLTSKNGEKPDVSHVTLSPAQTIAECRNKPLGFSLAANPEHPMIQSRGISVETAKAFGAGYYRSKQGTASMDDRIIFPLHEDGLVGYLGRATLESQTPKWKFGAKHKTMLFGLERCVVDQPLILTESCWMVLWLYERGQQAASLMGSELTSEQEKKLEGFTTIVVALDSDLKGKEAAEKISSRLKRDGRRVIRALMREG